MPNISLEIRICSPVHLLYITSKNKRPNQGAITTIALSGVLEN